MKPETTAKIKYGVWGLICGAVIAMIIGFAWGGWTTSSTTQTMTKEAVLASQAAICVAQFMKQPNYEKKLKELGEVSRDRKSTRLNSSHGYNSYAVFCLKKKNKQTLNNKASTR